MSSKSVYLPEPPIENDRVQITGEEHRHLIVARVQPREVLEIFDGKGRVWTATVESVTKRGTLTRVHEPRHIERDDLDLILALAMIRIGAFELAIEKAVEVGV